MNKKIEPVDIRQTLQYTQQCILVLNPAWGPGVLVTGDSVITVLPIRCQFSSVTDFTKI